MKAQIQPQEQDDQQQWQELAAADPAFKSWNDQRNAEGEARPRGQIARPALERSARLDLPDNPAIGSIIDRAACRQGRLGLRTHFHPTDI